MSYNAKVYLVMIASPRDIYKEPDIVRKAIREWNALHSADKGVVLIPVSWDYDVPPTMGEHPQEVIDKHVLDKADLLVAIFWTRIGTPTKVAISGTVGEIQKHIEAGKPTMVYFSNESIKPDKLDKEQYDALIRFKQECQKNGLLGEFESADEFEKSFSRHLTKQIIENEYFVKSSSDSEMLLTEDDEYGEENLSDEAELLITEASKDPQGKIQKIAFLLLLMLLLIICSPLLLRIL